jgi:3-phosphoglycerate kinase
MAFTFIKAQGGQIGDSICEDDKTSLALSILEKAKEKKVRFISQTMWFVLMSSQMKQKHKSVQ